MTQTKQYLKKNGENPQGLIPTHCTIGNWGKPGAQEVAFPRQEHRDLLSSAKGQSGERYTQIILHEWTGDIYYIIK